MNAKSTFRELFDEIEPLIGIGPVYGPPVVLLAVPWLLLVLMLAGPFTVLITFVVLFAAVAALAGLIGAVLVTPFLLVRRLRRLRVRHAPAHAPAPPVLLGGHR
jgi:membrane associated rhomboid family serine protease